RDIGGNSVLELIRNYIIATLEFSTLIILSLTSFKFKIELYKIEILSISVLLGAVSIALIKANLLHLLVPIHLMTLCVLFRFFLNEKWLYSLWIASFGYVFYALIQTFCVFSFSATGFYSIQESASSLFTIKSNIGQVASSFIALCISLTIRI